MDKLMIHILKSIKAQLDALRAQGTSASGLSGISSRNTSTRPKRPRKADNNVRLAYARQGPV